MKSTDWIKHLNLTPHPEGGYFSETYRNANEISDHELHQKYTGKRNLATSIYFLLESGQISKLHRLKSDEIWYFHHGSPILIHIFHHQVYKNLTMGTDIGAGHCLQAILPAGAIFGAEVLDPESFSIVGCMVSPGFHFDDFELISASGMVGHYPDQSLLIHKLT